MTRQMKWLIFLICLSLTRVACQPGKCNQKPGNLKVSEPREKNELFKLTIDTKQAELKNNYLPDQTYVLKLTAENERPFRAFMITAEDPRVDDTNSNIDYQGVDVGMLSTLDPMSRHSEKCRSSIENADNSDKSKVEIHWQSPKTVERGAPKIRFRATVAENEEVWYTGDNLTVILERNANRPDDSPPFDPYDVCYLCSEARYEVIFQGQWSRMTHPRNYPTKPDENGFSHMVGASHSFDYTLWKQSDTASESLKILAERGNITQLEREIIGNMSSTDGTRTLIRGKRRWHPHMLEPSHSLFRVDRIHHLFSLVIGLRPSPDWFLGTSRFELCLKDGWLKEYKMPLYPWDAGTMDGISYDSIKTVSQPQESVERVAVGSFDTESPFYQMNLNDLKPFGYLHVKLIETYPSNDEQCPGNEASVRMESATDTQENIEQESIEEPKILESHMKEVQKGDCRLSDWSEWGTCIPDNGSCGIGVQIRTREVKDKNSLYGSTYNDQKEIKHCTDTEKGLKQSKLCFMDCITF